MKQKNQHALVHYMWRAPHGYAIEINIRVLISFLRAGAAAESDQLLRVMKYS
jgi:hypothetical protein